jgi:uncharacterized membrane protein YcaP (DUF421 family)
MDIKSLLLPTISPFEIFLRGTIIYLALFLLLRLVLKREAGTIGITDLLVVVLLADAAQNAMAGDYKSITDGLILVATLVFWSYILEWLGYRFPRFQSLIHPPPLLLVKNGKMLPRNMRREFITEDELTSKIRLQGVEDITQVKKAYMEEDGRISVIQKDNKQSQGARERSGGN